MKSIAVVLIAMLGLSACSDDTFFVEITVDPIYGKDGSIIDPRATVISPVAAN